MKRVSVRDFQLKPSKFLKELPIVLTKYNKDVAKIVTLEEDVLTYEPAEPHGEGWQKTCQFPNQRCQSLGRKYAIVYDDEDGEHRVEHYLCEPHKILAERQATSVERI